MKETLPTLYKLANLLSIIGHPLLTWTVFSVYISFRQLPVRNAMLISGLLIGGVVVPVGILTYRKVKQGKYSNFDISNRRQRAGFYPFVIGLMTLATGLLVVTNQPRSFIYGMGVALLLLIVSYGVNFFIKASMHTSLSIFLAWAGSLISFRLGVMLGLWAVLVAASRLILVRHTLLEVVIGALIGLVSGVGLHWLLSPN